MSDFVERPMVRACDLHDETTEKMRDRGAYVLVTQASHPLLYDCLEGISHDNGEGAGHADYTVPAEYDLRDVVEKELGGTTEEERFLLGCGGEDDQETISAKYNMEITNTFFTGFFLDFDDDETNAMLTAFMKNRGLRAD